jgi:hypothetical protein
MSVTLIKCAMSIRVNMTTATTNKTIGITIITTMEWDTVQRKCFYDASGL